MNKFDQIWPIKLSHLEPIKLRCFKLKVVQPVEEIESLIFKETITWLLKTKITTAKDFVFFKFF